MGRSRGILEAFKRPSLVIQASSQLRVIQDYSMLLLLLLVITDFHRFYGKSIPTKNMSLESLKFLSSRQALQDTAHFISRMSEIYSIKKWIVFGCSYAGSLSAWMRLKYPHLVLGSISSSGPLFAKLDFSEYFEASNYFITTIKIFLIFADSKEIIGLCS